MKTSKNKFTLLLMILSVGLLVMLQFFWLKNSYEKAFFDFSRHSNMIFRNSVFSLRDSLFIKNFRPVKADSAGFDNVGLFHRDSFNIKFYSPDTFKVPPSVQVVIAKDDSAAGVNLLRPLASRIHRMDGRQRSFIIRIGPDTLNLDTLQMYYSHLLKEVGIVLPFKIDHEEVSRPIKMIRQLGVFDKHVVEESMIARPYNDTLVTDRVYVNPMHGYAAIFYDVRASIVKEITPQIFFSVFLSIVTITSFVVIFGSLRSQQKLNELKNDFINNITHELKTPLATVSVALEALRDFRALENPERTQAYLAMAQNELSRLTLMTDKILKTSVFENQGISFIPERVDLHHILQQVLSSMKFLFDKKNIVVSYTQSGSDFVLDGSEMHLTNVVYNLVDNALKYSADNTRLELQLKNSGANIEFLIRDYGLGIAKEYQKKIFEKFFRVPTGDVHNVKGYGLGLNYVAGVVKKHGGKIEIESEIGKGSLFIIYLPINKND